MSNRIMLHLTGGRQAHIELCIDDGFFIPNRLCQIMTIRINDAASASAHKFRKFRYDIALTQVRGIRTASDNHISIYKETFPLDCNVLNSGLPFWIVIGVWRNIMVIPFDRVLPEQAAYSFPNRSCCRLVPTVFQ